MSAKKPLGGLVSMSHNVSRYSGNFLDPFFDNFFEDINSGNFGSLSMKTDIKEHENSYTLDIDLPGFDKNNISLSLKDGYLTVTAKVNRSINNENEKKSSFVHRERFSGSSTRSYYVGDVEEKDIHASYKDGVLSIELPKEDVKKVEEKHQIAIQ